VAASKLTLWPQESMWLYEYSNTSSIWTAGSNFAKGKRASLITVSLYLSPTNQQFGVSGADRVLFHVKAGVP